MQSCDAWSHESKPQSANKYLSHVQIKPQSCPVKLNTAIKWFDMQRTFHSVHTFYRLFVKPQLSSDFARITLLSVIALWLCSDIVAALINIILFHREHFPSERRKHFHPPNYWVLEIATARYGKLYFLIHRKPVKIHVLYDITYITLHDMWTLSKKVMS